MRRLKLEEAAQLLLAAKRPVLTAHVHADGDSLGSLLGLAELLASAGVEADLWLDDEVPAMYRFLPGWEKVQRLPAEVTAVPGDLLVVLDASDKERIGRMGDCVQAPILNIDHHVSNTGYADAVYLDTAAAATGEIITQLAQHLGVAVTPGAATSLYAAIATDCGFFRYANTTPATLRAAAQLVEAGARPEEISQALETRPLSDLLALQEVLSTLELHDQGRIAAITVTPDLDARTDSTEGFINYPRTVAGVEVAVLFKFQDDQHARVSLRSRGCDVSQVAASFGGGGHRRAAGCSVTAESAEGIRQQVLQAISRALGMNDSR